MSKIDKDIENLIQDDERISLYLQGRMTATEEASFMEELKANEELRQRAIAQARLIKGMKQADEELVDAIKQTDVNDMLDYIERRGKEKLEYERKQREKERILENKKRYKNVAISYSDSDQDKMDSIDSYPVISVSQKKKEEGGYFSSKPHVFRWLAYAASFILIVFIGFKGYDYYSTVNLGKQYANTFELSEIIRGESNAEVEEELRALFDNVKNGNDLSKTTKNLNSIWQIAKQDTYNDYTDYAPFIGWYLAIGYLRDYEKSKAKGVFAVLKEMYPEGNVIGAKIEEIMEKCD